MAVKLVIKDVDIIPMGFANAFLIESDDGLTLIDAGFPHKEAAVFGAIRGLGRSPDQLKHLILTHGHPGFRCEDLHAPARYPSRGERRSFRPLTPAPGLLGLVMCKIFFHPDECVAPVAIDRPLTAGEILPIAGGIEVVHAPGHCAGQVALLWEGRASQRKLAGLTFDAAGFGHGEPIPRDASTRFRNKYDKNLENVRHQRSAA